MSKDIKLMIKTSTLAKKIFELSNNLDEEILLLSRNKYNSIREYIKDMFNKFPTCYPSIFILVTRYLISSKLEAMEIKETLFKYSVLLSSLIIYEDISKNPFKTLLKGSITLDKIKTYKPRAKTNKLAKIYLQKEYTNEYIKECPKAHYILINNINFFTRRNNLFTFFTKTDNRKPFDLLIAEELAERKELYDLDFSLTSKEYDDYKKNVIGNDYFPCLSLLVPIFYKAIYKGYKKIKTEAIIFYQLISFQTNNQLSYNKIRFIVENDESAIKTIAFNMVSPFSFTLNGIHFLIDQNGFTTIDEKR